MTWLRLLESVHGYFGVLAVVGLLHPALLLRSGMPLSQGGRWAVFLSTLVTLLACGLGLSLYADYRTAPKTTLLAEHFQAAMLFERKEHFAFLVCTLSVAGCLCALTASPEARGLRRLAATFFAVSVLFGVATATLGAYVSSVQGFW